MTPRFVYVLSGIAAVLLTTVGCENPWTRAHDHPAAFARLTAADKRLVLAGRIHAGMSAETVYIAWGEPDEKRVTGSGKEAAERWLYHRQLTVKAPMGSFDQLSAGNSVVGLAVPLTVGAGFGFGGIGNEGGLLYQPHLQIADATVKQVDFLGGSVEGYRVFPWRFAPLD